MAGMPYPPNLCASVQSVGVFVGGYGIPAIPTLPSEFLPQNPLQVCLRKSSHRIHRIHRSFRRRIFSHRLHRCTQIFLLRQSFLCVPRILWEDSLVAAWVWQGCHTLLICVYLCNLWEDIPHLSFLGSVASVGR